jgi:hypothetical protein
MGKTGTFLLGAAAGALAWALLSPRPAVATSTTTCTDPGTGAKFGAAAGAVWTFVDELFDDD